MTGEDFIFLNVPGLLRRYVNPSPNWQAIVRAFSQTQLKFFQQNHLISPDAHALKVPIDEVVLRSSDLTEIGQAFVKSGSIGRWLASCDRKKALDAYRDPADLQRRLENFLRERAPKQ